VRIRTKLAIVKQPTWLCDLTRRKGGVSVWLVAVAAAAAAAAAASASTAAAAAGVGVSRR